MSLFEILVSLVGIVSFCLFLIFYKKIKPSSFWGKTHPANFWAMAQVVLGGSRLGGRIAGWIKRTDTDYEPILSIVVFTVTGVIMVILARKAVVAKLKENTIG